MIYYLQPTTTFLVNYYVIFILQMKLGYREVKLGTQGHKAKNQ